MAAGKLSLTLFGKQYMNIIEIIGIVATLFILFSMSCKTSTKKSTIILRVTNIVGCIIFVVYGILLPAYSTAVLNGLLVFVNTYHLIKIIRDKA